MPTVTPSPAKGQGSNAWPGWEIMVLHDLGAPTSKDNIAFLDLWQQFENSKAQNNPLNLTGPSGTGSINSDGVQNYATREQGAKYTAQNITHYPTLYKMLKSNNVKGTLLGSTDIIHGKLSPLSHLVDDLRKWGSKSFADQLSGGTSAIDKGTQVAHDAAAPFNAAIDAFNWVKDNWDRILFVIGGTILVIIGIVVLLRQNQNNTFTFERGES